MLMRKHDDSRLVLLQKVEDGRYARRPMGGVLFSRANVHLFEAVRRNSLQPEANEIASAPEFMETLGLPVFFASLRNGDVDHIEVHLAHKAHGDGANDTFIVGVRGEE